MLDPRLYRAALLPVLLALIVVAFSLENRPAPLRTTLTPDAFDQVRAGRMLDELVRDYPVRPAGSAADTQLAGRVAAELRIALPGVRVERRVSSAHTPDGERELVTVLAQQPGSAPRAQVVIVAARDASGRGGAAQLSGTAAMIELARVIAATRPSRSVTFASVSGETGGQGGMRELAKVLDRPVDAVIELGDMAGPPADRLLVVPWSDGSGMAPMRLQRTVALALRQEAAVDARVPFARDELARFAWPWSASGQGVLNAAGIPAVRLSASGEPPPSPRAPVSVERLGEFGRAALRAVTALETGPRVGQSPSADLSVARKVLPGWALRLLVLALLTPALLTLVDATARARRRREPVAVWIGRVLIASIPFALGALFARGLGLTGAVPDTAPPPLPSAAPLDGTGWLTIGCTIAVVLLVALLLRPFITGAAAERERSPGAALAPLVVTGLIALVAWVVNPFAALLLVLPLNVWLLTATREARVAPVVLAPLVLLSLVPVVLVVLSVAGQLDVTIVQAPWLVLLWVAGGQAGPVAVIGCALTAGAATAVLRAALRPRIPPGGDQAITVRGPASYAGPGSLGGTDSALRG